MSRTLIVMVNGFNLCSTEPFEEFASKLEMARESMAYGQEDDGRLMGNPLGPPLVRTEVIFETEPCGPSLAAINPFHVLAIYQYPEGDA